jgi:hypothetical protein
MSTEGTTGGALTPAAKEHLQEGLPFTRLLEGSLDANGLLHGRCKLTQPSPDGSELIEYEGTFEHGVFGGPDVTVRFPKPGGFYEGAWHNGAPLGQGRRRRPDGTLEVCEFRGFALHGRGRCDAPSGGAYRERTIVNGILHGPDCTIRHEGGALYEGAVADGALHGRGRLSSTAASYDGEWLVTRVGEQRPMRQGPPVPRSYSGGLAHVWPSAASDAQRRVCATTDA